MKAAFLLRPQAGGQRRELSGKTLWRGDGGAWAAKASLSWGRTLSSHLLRGRTQSSHKTAPLPGEETHFLGQPSFCTCSKKTVDWGYFFKGGWGVGPRKKYLLNFNAWRHGFVMKCSLIDGHCQMLAGLEQQWQELIPARAGTSGVTFGQHK